MIDLCLINPPHPYLVDPHAQAPLGLLYVGASARDAGLAVGMLNMSGVGHDEVAAVEFPECRMFGITGTVLDRKMVEEVARAIRKQQPRTRVIVGGPITINEKDLDRKLFDAFVVGEGEHVIKQIAKDFPNLKRRYVGERIKDLDSLPLPARDLLGGRLGGNVFANWEAKFGDESTVISTSRGCPSACKFCASPGLWKRRIVYRDPEAIAAEVREVVERWGVRQFRFSDDNITIQRERFAAICEALSKVSGGVAWRASIRVKPNDREVFEILKHGGCTEVSFGVESADPAVLDALGKGVTPADSEAAIRNAKAVGLKVRVLMMVGCPGMTRGTVDKEIEFLERLRPFYDTVSLTNFTPLPGTYVHDHPAECGCEILDRDVDHYNLCMWGPNGDRNTWRNLVRPVGMSLDALTAEKERLVWYVVNRGKVNCG